MDTGADTVSAAGPAPASFDPTWSPIFILLLVFTLAHAGVSIFLFHTRGDRFPISGHSRWLVYTVVISITTANIAHMTAGILAQRVSCGIIFCFTILVFFTASAFFVRAWRVWFRYLLQSERLTATTLDQRWFQERSYWFTDSRLVAISLFTGALQWTAVFAAFVVDPDWGQLASDNACPSIATAQNVAQGVIGFDLLLVGYVSYRVRNVYDAFGIKADLRSLFVESLILTLVVIGRDRWYDNNIYRVLWWALTQAVIFTISTVKVYRSYQYPKQYNMLGAIDSREISRTMEKLSSRRESVSAPQATKLSQHLDAVFSDPMLLEEFTEHLKREFSVENLLFCQAAKEFHDKCVNGGFKNVQEKNERAARIFLEFVHGDAPSQVNLNSQYPTAIYEVLRHCFVDFNPAASMSSLHFSDQSGEVPADLFEPARKQIYRLMERDTFVRFKSKKYNNPPRRARSILRNHTFANANANATPRSTSPIATTNATSMRAPRAPHTDRDRSDRPPSISHPSSQVAVAVAVAPAHAPMMMMPKPPSFPAPTPAMARAVSASTSYTPRSSPRFPTTHSPRGGTSSGAHSPRGRRVSISREHSKSRSRSRAARGDGPVSMPYRETTMSPLGSHTITFGPPRVVTTNGSGGGGTPRGGAVAAFPMIPRSDSTMSNL